jgi:hypothetical protein
MNHGFLTEEIMWLQRVLGSELERLGLSEDHIYAVLIAVYQDIRLSHPDFNP